MLNYLKSGSPCKNPPTGEEEAGEGGLQVCGEALPTPWPEAAPLPRGGRPQVHLGVPPAPAVPEQDRSGGGGHHEPTQLPADNIQGKLKLAVRIRIKPLINPKFTQTQPN